MKIVKSKSWEFSPQGKSMFFYFFNFVSLWDEGCSLNLFHDVVSQIIMLYTLNLYGVVCQLYPNKTGGKKEYAQ